RAGTARQPPAVVPSPYGAATTGPGAPRSAALPPEQAVRHLRLPVVPCVGGSPSIRQKGPLHPAGVSSLGAAAVGELRHPVWPDGDVQPRSVPPPGQQRSHALVSA